MKYVLLKEKNKMEVEVMPLQYFHSEVNDWKEIAVKYIGICHSDKLMANNPVKLPIVLGHEIVCYEKINNEIKYYVVSNEIPCNECKYCKEGNFSHCKKLIELGVNEHGGYAEFIRVPRKNLIPIHFENSKLGILVEPLSCILHAYQRIKIFLDPDNKVHPTVLIVGAGVMGKLFAYVIQQQALNCKVFIHDINTATKENLHLEKTMFTMQPESESMDVVIECSGAPDSLEKSVQFVKKAGTIFLFGLYNSGVSIPLSALEFIKKELTISSALAGSNNINESRSMMEQAIHYISNDVWFFEQFLGEAISLINVEEFILKKSPLPGTRTYVEVM